MWNEAIITNAGMSVYNRWIGGAALTLTSAKGGDAVTSNPAAATNLVRTVQTLSILGTEPLDGGHRVRVQVTSAGLTEGYKLRQVGIWGQIGSETPVLLILLQDTDGLPVPAAADNPDFVCELGAFLQAVSAGSFSAVIDSKALVSRATMTAAVSAHNTSATAHQDIRLQLTSPFNFKGDVADLTALEAIQNPEQNDTYYVTSLMCRYSWTGSAWAQSSLEESEYEDELSDVKNTLEATTDTQLIDGFTKGSYIKTALSTGAAVSLTPVTSANFAWKIVSVTPGEVYNISGTGGFNGCLYAFADFDGKLIGHSATEVTLENHDIYVPASASNMIVNVVHANPYRLYKKEINPLKSKQIPVATERYGVISTVGTVKWQVNTVGKHFIVAVNPGDDIKITTGVNQTNVAFMTLYGEAMHNEVVNNFASGTGVTNVSANNEYHATVPNDAHFLYVQTLTNDNYSRMPSSVKINGYDILQEFSLNFGESLESLEKIDTLDGRFYITKIADLSWELGTIDGSTGQPSSNGARCRTVDFLDVGTNPSKVSFDINDTKFTVYYYDSNKAYISASSWITNSTEITNFGNAKYIKLIGGFSNNATVTNANIPGIADDITVTQRYLKTMSDVYAELDDAVKTPLTIMTFNVQNFTGLNSNETMHEVIEEKYNPDIIGMQEFIETINGDSIYGEVFKSYQYHFRYSGIPTPNGIISKKRLFDTAGVEFTHQSINDPDATAVRERRAYSKAYIYHEGKKICWLNTHLDLNTSTSFLQMAELKSVMDAEDYSILTVDTNINITSFGSTNYINAIKPFVDAGYNVSNNSEAFGINWTFSNSVTGETLRQSLDTIIVSGNMDIRSFVVDKTKLDFLNGTNVVDHVPVVIKAILN